MVCSAWRGWWLALLVVFGSPVAAQVSLPRPTVELKEHYPNHFSPSTTIPFTIHPEVCLGGHQPVVSLKIYNVLVQVVAVPTLLTEIRERLDGRRLHCGEHRAYWNGKFVDGKRDAGSGVYYYQLTVDGQRYTRKMILQRNEKHARSRKPAVNSDSEQ